MKGFLTAKRSPTPDAAARSWPPPEIRIAAIYLILASAWIVGSDLLLSECGYQESLGTVVQSIKGLNFVLTTAVLLYLVLRRAYGGWRLAETRRLAVIEQARERFQQLSSHIQTLREDDRTHIAREIHDELGQLLTGLKMELRQVEDQLSNRNDRSLNPMIDKLVEISELVDTTIGSVQRIASGLRPSSLDILGLGPALMDEAVQFSDRSGIPCSILIGKLPDPLSPDVATTAFRIFQEALTNVARHAQARRIDAKVSAEDGVLQLVIRDDGLGIDPKVLEDPKSFGLIGMLERAKNIGGRVEFSRHPEKGTNVILSVPLPTPPNSSNLP